MASVYFNQEDVSGAEFKLPDCTLPTGTDSESSLLEYLILSELDLVRNPGAWKVRRLSDSAFHRLYHPEDPVVAFGPGAISGAGLIAMAAQRRHQQGVPSLNVIGIKSPETDIFELNSSGGPSSFYAVRGFIVDGKGTAYYGEFPSPIPISLFDGSSLSRANRETPHAILSEFPFVNPISVVSNFDNKQYQKTALWAIGEEHGVLIPDYMFLKSDQIPWETNGEQSYYAEMRDFVSSRCPQGVAIKPNRGSIGNGVTLTYDSSLPSDDLLRRARMNENGVIVEERIESVPFHRNGVRYDWNLRVLMSTHGIVGIEVRYDEIGGPVNISRGAKAREFTVEFLKGLTPPPANAANLHREIIGIIENFGTATCQAHSAGYTGLDIIISHETLYKRTDRRPHTLQDGFFLACNEINVGSVGGQSTLAKIRRTPTTKLRAPNQWIDLTAPHLDSGVPLAADQQIGLVQLGKYTNPGNIIRNVFLNSLSNLTDDEFVIFCRALIHLLQGDRFRLTETDFRSLLEEFKTRQKSDLACEFAQKLGELPDNSGRLCLFGSLILKQFNQNTSSYTQLIKALPRFKNVMINQNELDTLQILLELDPALGIQIIKEWEELARNYQGRSLRATMGSGALWITAFAQLGDQEMVGKIVKKAIEIVASEMSAPSRLTDEAEISAVRIRRAINMRESLIIIKQVGENVLALDDLNLRIKILEEFCALINTALLRMIDFGEIRAGVRASLFDAYVRTGDFKKASQQNELLALSDEDWMQKRARLEEIFDPIMLGIFRSSLGAEDLETLVPRLMECKPPRPLPKAKPNNSVRNWFFENSYFARSITGL